MKIIMKGSSCYPQKLLEIEEAPQVLYTLGNVDLLNTSSISIIGSRSCSEEGKNIAKKFASELALQGITVISGLAKGIDRAAHEGALEVGGNTIAVLGNGFNHIFPKENKGLFKEIADKGLIITEYPVNEKARSEYFLKRNRIVSGLSLGVLVIEAAYRSGTSVTASLAKSQGKEIFCIPHAINDKHGVGTNRLIARGAKLVTKTKEIIDEFSFLEYDETKQMTVVRPKVKKEYKKVFDAVGLTPTEKEEICYKSKTNIKEVNSILLMLEIEGYVEKVAGGYKCVVNK